MSKKLYYAFVSIAIVLVGFVYLGIADLIYSSSIKSEESKIKYFISSISSYCSASVDKQNLAYLIDNIKPNMPEADRRVIEQSPQFQAVLKQLHLIGNHFSDYCTYIYIIYPIDDQTYFVIGNDYFEIKNIDKYSEAFNTSPFPFMEQALKERRPITEPDLSYDPDYKIYSISAYAPIYSDYRFLGVVGLDLQKSDYDKLRYSYAVIGIIISFLGLSCMVTTTLFISEKISQHNISKRK